MSVSLPRDVCVIGPLLEAVVVVVRLDPPALTWTAVFTSATSRARQPGPPTSRSMRLCDMRRLSPYPMIINRGIWVM
jgi:hypothetical protein